MCETNFHWCWILTCSCRNCSVTTNGTMGENLVEAMLLLIINIYIPWNQECSCIHGSLPFSLHHKAFWLPHLALQTSRFPLILLKELCSLPSQLNCIALLLLLLITHNCRHLWTERKVLEEEWSPCLQWHSPKVFHFSEMYLPVMAVTYCFTWMNFTKWKLCLTYENTV